MRVEVRATEAFIRRLDAFAEARGTNRSQAVRLAVSEASTGVAVELPAPPNRDELLRLLGVEARVGNIAAIRILLRELKQDRDAAQRQGDVDGLSWIDGLAAREWPSEISHC